MRYQCSFFPSTYIFNSVTANVNVSTCSEEFSRTLRLLEWTVLNG
jgi:hypothetical protein